VRECDVAGEVVRAMFAAGADTLIAHPQISADPLRRMAADRVIRHGDIVLVDINVGCNGYAGDFARSVIVGKPTAEQKDVYKVQLSCLQTAIALVTPGASPKDIHHGVRRVVESAGLTDYWHSYITGHGIGTGSPPYEEPMIGERGGNVEELEPGMVIALEPGIFKPGVGPVRVEEMVLVTETGHEVLTRFGYDERLLE